MKKVLVCDDEPFFIEVFTQLLGKAGFEVCSARNGAEAIAKAGAEKPDLIIMDVMMPVMSGFDATQKIRQVPGMEKVPIIVFTSRGSMGDFFAGMPGIEVLIKTVGADAVISRVQALIGDPSSSTGGVQKRAILLGVEDGVLDKVGALLKKFGYEVVPALHEKEALTLVEQVKPAAIFSQLWEDDTVLDAPKMARDLLANPATARIPVYVFCKESLSVEAMKQFDAGRIVAYKETSGLLQKLEELLRAKQTPV